MKRITTRIPCDAGCRRHRRGGPVAAKLLLAMLAAVLPAVALHAEAPRVSAHIEPDSIFIGDRFTYVIEVEKDLVQSVMFPEFTPDAECGVELVESLPVDTLERDGRRLKVRKRYVMAAFQEGIFDMGKGAVLYADKNIVDTLHSDESSRLLVATFVIDSTSHPIFDIKPQKTLPFRFGEISGYLLRALLAAVLLAGAVYLLVRWLRKRGKSLKSIFTPAPPVPPHVAAIKALEELHNRKLWQNNRHKLYYSELSDILRTYISGRYGVKAMEMTTDEIIDAVKEIEMAPKCSADLVTVLRDADLAKFAKFEPDAEQNEGDWSRVYYFVEETKEVAVQESGDEAEILDNKLKGV